MSEERLYLCLERQTHPSWMRSKCQIPSKGENLKERGAPLRVLVRIGDMDE
jgi:hypothetical protein